MIGLNDTINTISFRQGLIMSLPTRQPVVVLERFEDQQTKTAVIKTEPKVSFVCGDCMHISYRLYLELPATLYGCTCETKIWL